MYYRCTYAYRYLCSVLVLAERTIFRNTVFKIQVELVTDKNTVTLLSVTVLFTCSFKAKYKPNENIMKRRELSSYHN